MPSTRMAVVVTLISRHESGLCPWVPGKRLGARSKAIKKRDEEEDSDELIFSSPKDDRQKPAF